MYDVCQRSIGISYNLQANEYSDPDKLNKKNEIEKRKKTLRNNR